MSILDIFRKDDSAINELNDKVNELEKELEKSLGNTSITYMADGIIRYGGNDAERSFQTHYTVNRGIDLLADNIAGLPLRIMRGEEIMPQDYTIKGFDLMNPNPLMSLNELIYVCSVYYFYRGEFMINIKDDEGIIMLEPINPRSMTIKGRSQNGYITDWEWREGSQVRQIPQENLIYTKLFNPDGERGLSPVDVVKNELLNDHGANQFALKFFENFAQIGGKLYDELGTASKDDMKAMVDQFNQAHRGSSKAHKVLGLPKGIKYQQDAQTMREMDFLSSRRDIRDRVLSALGIHKAVFGVTDQVDRAVADAAMRQLWTQTLKPKAIRIQEKWNQHLMRRYFPGHRVMFDFSEVEVLQENRESQLSQAKIYRDLGYTTNEINALFGLGMEEVTDTVGDMRFVPNSLIPVDELLLDPEPVDNNSNSNKALDKLGDYLDKNFNLEKSSARYTRRALRAQRKTEVEMTRTLRDYFSAELRKVLRLIRKNKSIDKIDSTTLLSLLQNLLTEQKQVLADRMTPDYEKGGTRADRLALGALGQDTAEAKFPADVVAGLTLQVKSIPDHTYKLLRKEIVEGVAEGESVNQIAKRITQVYKFNVSRSRTIARTESAALQNRTTDVRYRASNVEKKQWVDAGDSEVRDTHNTNTAKGVVAYDYTYPNGQLFPNDGIGGASENVNCRCVHVPVID